jgi:hypothetical protein
VRVIEAFYAVNKIAALVRVTCVGADAGGGK